MDGHNDAAARRVKVVLGVFSQSKVRHQEVKNHDRDTKLTKWQNLNFEETWKEGQNTRNS